MINNYNIIPNKFKCKKLLANYLIYEKHFPILSVDGKYYYFLHNDLLEETLERLPPLLKLISLIG